MRLKSANWILQCSMDKCAATSSWGRQGVCWKVAVTRDQPPAFVFGRDQRQAGGGESFIVFNREKAGSLML
jgi:hypothetical protein